MNRGNGGFIGIFKEPTPSSASGISALYEQQENKLSGIWPGIIPGAPTIGTATQTGTSSATVTFTAPTNTGGSTITSYTAVSSPGGITGTLNQSGSGTITITGLSENTNYTFTVYATNVNGNGLVSAASNQITTAMILDGTTSARANSSAAAIKALTGTNTDGLYYINLPTVGVQQVYCLMNSSWDGGGWMMAMKATRGTTFTYSSSYWTSTNTLNTGSINQNDGDAKFDTMNYFSAKDMLARWPDIGQGGSFSYGGNWIWLQNNFYAGNRVTMVNWFNSVNRYFIQDAKTYSGWANGVFSSQADIRFYGYNWTDNLNSRWGFGWNENGGGLYPNGVTGSDDVNGGIGTSYHSAGDQINCCQDSTGINRSARVEIYIR